MASNLFPSTNFAVKARISDSYISCQVSLTGFLSLSRVYTDVLGVCEDSHCGKQKYILINTYMFNLYFEVIYIDV